MVKVSDLCTLVENHVSYCTQRQNMGQGRLPCFTSLLLDEIDHSEDGLTEEVLASISGTMFGGMPSFPSSPSYLNPTRFIF